MTQASTTILLLGSDAALLEGLSQSLAALGYAPRVALAVAEGREIASLQRPLIVVASCELAGDEGAELLAVPLAPGGALVLFHGSGHQPVLLTPTMQRAVLADLTLPLERHRLVALVQHVVERTRATGRRPDNPPEQVAY